MELNSNSLKVRLVFELKVEADVGMDSKNIVNIIADEIRIRKTYDGFSVTGFEMDYEVYKSTNMMEVREEILWEKMIMLTTKNFTKK